MNTRSTGRFGASVIKQILGVETFLHVKGSQLNWFDTLITMPAHFPGVSNREETQKQIQEHLRGIKSYT